MADAITIVRENIVTVVVGGPDLLEPLVDQAKAARDVAEAAAATALAASGPNYANTATGLAATADGEAFAVDNGDGTVTVYLNDGGLAVPQRSLATTAFLAATYVTQTGEETITNKTFEGNAPFLTDGGRMILTSATAAPSSPVGLLHLQNEDAHNVGILVNCFWEGSTGDEYVNNDTTLFVTYNRTLSDSANRSWSASCSNNYNDIPEGVTDSGTRVGVIGWAGSVAKDGYVHAGTLAEQAGVRGTAGFQGEGSAPTAIVQTAVGVEGLIINQSVGATIQNAIAGRFISIEDIGNVLDSTAVYARAENGTNSNYSFFGAAGLLFNVDPIISDTFVRAPEMYLEEARLADIDGSFHRLWTQDGSIALRLGTSETIHTRLSHRFCNPALTVDYAVIDANGIRSNTKFQIGANTLADADGGSHRLWTPGGNIWAQGSNGLNFIRGPETRIASADAGTNFAVFAASGAIIRMDTYANNAGAVAAGKAVGTMYKTAAGEVRVVV